MSKINRKINRRNELVSRLKQSEIKEMFELFEQYYDHTTFEQFAMDLKEKTHIFFFFEKGTNRLIGFSTIFRKKIPSLSPGIFLFSGDTVIHEDYWGSKALQKSFFWFILESKILSPFRPVYWLLMSKGVKTYLMMRKNFPASYPNYKEETPQKFKHITNGFYHLKFTQNYNPLTGLIVFKNKMGSVKKKILESYKKETKDHDATFFFSKNPKHEEGEELACVAEIRFSDFLFHIFKFFIPIIKR